MENFDGGEQPIQEHTELSAQHDLTDTGMEGVADDNAYPGKSGPTPIKKKTLSSIMNKSDPLDMNFLVDLPEHVEIMNIPRLSEIKQIWHQGMKRLEEVF